MSKVYLNKFDRYIKGNDSYVKYNYTRILSQIVFDNIFLFVLRFHIVQIAFILLKGNIFMKK